MPIFAINKSNQFKFKEMKTFTIDIHPLLQNVTFDAEESFEESLIKGEYQSFRIEVAEKDIARVKRFVEEHASDITETEYDWLGKCNGYAMDLVYAHYIKPEESLSVFINTYRPYGQYGPIQYFDKRKVSVWMKKDIFDRLRENGELSVYIY